MLIDWRLAVGFYAELSLWDGLCSDLDLHRYCTCCSSHSEFVCAAATAVSRRQFLALILFLPFLLHLYYYFKTMSIYLCRLFHWDSASRGQKRVSDLLKLELEATESGWIWVPEIELRFSRRAWCTLNQWAKSLTPYFFMAVFCFVQ